MAGGGQQRSGASLGTEEDTADVLSRHRLEPCPSFRETASTTSPGPQYTAVCPPTFDARERAI